MVCLSVFGQWKGARETILHKLSLSRIKTIFLNLYLDI